MKVQISNSGIKIESKKIEIFGIGVGCFDSLDYGVQYPTLVLSYNERLSKVLLGMQGSPTVYFYDSVIYVVIEGDPYHYIKSLEKDVTGIAEKIRIDKMLALSIMSKDEKDIEIGVLNVITE